ncbi:MAG: FAD-dependent oxidoreductase [Acidilobus sp.]|nr:FAD-dependent oxidoreductase [Acidilobus sp.]
MEILVIGGGAAGMSAASWARRKAPEARITVLERTNIISHAPCGVPYYIGGLFKDYWLLQAYDVKFFRERRNIEVLTNAEAEELDVRSRVVVARVGGQRVKLEFDRLIVATGARPRRLLSADARVLYVHHPADAEAARRAAEAAREVTVVGGGVLGVEVAEQLRNMGKAVHLVHRGPYLMSRDLDEELGSALTQMARGAGIDVRLGVTLSEVNDGRVRLSDGSYLNSDLVIAAVGVEPNVDLVRGQLRLGPHGAIAVNDRMEATYDYVFAAGDVMEHRNLVTGQPDWSPLAPIANKSGLVAGVNAAGGDKRFPGVLGDIVTRFEGVAFGRVGLNEREAREAGIRYVTSIITTRSRARYYPGGGDVTVKLLAEESSGIIIGGQVAGPEEVIGRLGVIAAAIMKRMTAEELFFVEIGYHPSSGRAWDPVVLAARQLMKV